MNVLLVDDQEKILEATRKLVNWNKLRVDSVFTANSAAAARKVLADEEIDIMLADIEMPGENGIELQKWVAEEYPSVACIFLTSHADFTYAQKAIHNGAIDYILQPASMATIEESLEKCIRKLEAKQSILHKSSQYDANLANILKNHVFSMFHQKAQFGQLDEWRRDSHTEGEGWWYLPCLLRIWEADSQEVEEMLNLELEKTMLDGSEVFAVASRLNDEEIGILIYGNGMIPERSFMESRIWSVCEGHIGEKNLYMGQCGGEELPQLIGQVMAFKAGRILEKNEVYHVDAAIPYEIRQPDSAVWGRWMLRNDTELIKNQITNLLRFAQKDRYLTVSYMQKLIHAFLESCSIACYEQKHNLTELFTDTFTYEKMLHSYSSVDELSKGVDFCLRRYRELISERADNSSFSVQERIQEILRYLDENMDRMISRREAAKYVFLNEDYFSRMFRRETGMGYKEYIVKQKMDYAGKLLVDTNMPIALVASKVGYDNYTNFTQTFRKATGLTPTDYRKQYHNMPKSEN
ncbi:MAG: response regulator [Eubacteriales bacterium]|nr:response regulator [Eubacteriales bacterium]